MRKYNLINYKEKNDFKKLQEKWHLLSYKENSTE